MKIFFTASLRGQNEFGHLYTRMFKHLKKMGFTHLDDEILKLSSSYYDSIQKQGQSAFVDLYKRKIKNLQIADVCFFEVSIPSLSIGYCIQKALDFNKPTIILYYKNTTPQFISGIEEDKLIVKQYDDANLEKMVEEAIGEAKHLQDKRFNFFISPNLLNYLEKTSKAQDITKSTFIRNLLLEHKKKNTTLHK